MSETLPQPVDAKVPATTPKPQDDAAAALVALNSYFASTLKDLGKLIEEKTSVYLVGFGSLVIVVGLAMMVRDGDGDQLADLTSSEFIAVLLVGLCLIGLGAARAIFQFRGIVEVEQKKIEEGAKLAGAIHGVAEDG